MLPHTHLKTDYLAPFRTRHLDATGSGASYFAGEGVQVVTKIVLSVSAQRRYHWARFKNQNYPDAAWRPLLNPLLLHGSDPVRKRLCEMRWHVFDFWRARSVCGVWLEVTISPSGTSIRTYEYPRTINTRVEIGLLLSCVCLSWVCGTLTLVYLCVCLGLGMR